MKTIRLGSICSDFTCAKCCFNTAMLLSSKDIQTIRNLGYKEEDFTEINDDGLIQLQNVDGTCFFLKENKCTIYQNRPQGCRFYPIIFNLETNRAILDDECPLRNTISGKTVKKFEKDLKKFVSKLLE